MVSKKTICLGVGSIAMAFMLNACGGGIPSCDDSDVQDLVKSIYTDGYLENLRIPTLKESNKPEVVKYAKELEQILKDDLKLKMDSFTTERKDEKRNRVVCRANIGGDMKDDKIQKFLETQQKIYAANQLDANTVLTDAKFDEYKKSQYGSESKYLNKLDKEAEKLDREFDANQHIVNYSARRTDDGKLLVETE